MSGRLPGRVRIVGGSRRGRRLKVPPGHTTRPTAEKVREAIFDALGSVKGATVLDLFAGTGALGLEALSRGAEACVFVEEDPVAVATLRENIAALGYQDVCRVIKANYARALRSLVQEGRRFNLLFMDPPYRMLAEVEATVAPLLSALVAVEGLVVVEGDRALEINLAQCPVFDRAYGDTRVVMIKMRRDTQ